MAFHFSGLEATGFGFDFQIMILEVTGFGLGFLNFKMEATGFGFGLGFLSPTWLRLRSHQPGFHPNPATHIPHLLSKTNHLPNIALGSLSMQSINAFFFVMCLVILHIFSVLSSVPDLCMIRDMIVPEADLCS